MARLSNDYPPTPKFKNIFSKTQEIALKNGKYNKYNIQDLPPNIL